MTAERKYFILPDDLLQVIGGYLSERPWQEVNLVMPALQSLQRYTPPEIIQKEETPAEPDPVWVPELVEETEPPKPAPKPRRSRAKPKQ